MIECFQTQLKSRKEFHQLGQTKCEFLKKAQAQARDKVESSQAW